MGIRANGLAPCAMVQNEYIDKLRNDIFSSLNQFNEKKREKKEEDEERDRNKT